MAKNESNNSVHDLIFAIGYVDFVARRGHTPQQRARAQLVQAAIKLLDQSGMNWRAELLEALNASEHARAIADIFPIPNDLGDDFVSKYIETTMKAIKHENDTN